MFAGPESGHVTWQLLKCHLLRYKSGWLYEVRCVNTSVPPNQDKNVLRIIEYSSEKNRTVSPRL